MAPWDFSYFTLSHLYFKCKIIKNVRKAQIMHKFTTKIVVWTQPQGTSHKSAINTWRKQKPKQILHPVIAAMKPDNQGEEDQGSSLAIYLSTREEDRVTSDHQGERSPNANVNQQLEEGVSSVSFWPRGKAEESVHSIIYQRKMSYLHSILKKATKWK